MAPSYHSIRQRKILKFTTKYQNDVQYLPLNFALRITGFKYCSKLIVSSNLCVSCREVPSVVAVAHQKTLDIPSERAFDCAQLKSRKAVSPARSPERRTRNSARRIVKKNWDRPAGRRVQFAYSKTQRGKDSDCINCIQRVILTTAAGRVIGSLANDPRRLSRPGKSGLLLVFTYLAISV